MRKSGFAVATGLVTHHLFAPTRNCVRWIAVDLHDHPVLQARAMQVSLADDVEERRLRLWQSNVEEFETLIVPSLTFARYAGLGEDRLLIIPNGTAMYGRAPLPMPDRPVIGMASGAARGRGIEDLVAAARLARERVPDLELKLWLAANDVAAEEYIQSLQAMTSSLPWVEISSPSYAEVFAATSRASLLVIPHPPNEYMDVALPVATPRTETALVIRSESAGWVTEGDGVESLAEGISSALQSKAELEARGARGWELAQGRYSWERLSAQVSEALLQKSAFAKDAP